MRQPAYKSKLTRAAAHVASRLEENNKPVISHFEFSLIVQAMYQESSGKKLYLRRKTPDRGSIERFKSILFAKHYIGEDRDYGFRIIRILAVSDLPAEDVVCLVDPTCYVSHLSAMQRWGLTNRTPKTLALTRPDRKTAIAALRAKMEKALTDRECGDAYPLTLIKHPPVVRRRNIHMYESKMAGASIDNRGTCIRLSTIGQTFLDMLQKPDLCGGMSHVLEVWDEHAATFLNEIVSAIDQATGSLVKCRAGYILEERLKLNHPAIENWKALGQRGGSRRLDPSREFSPDFSETWMISLNA